MNLDYGTTVAQESMEEEAKKKGEEEPMLARSRRVFSATWPQQSETLGALLKALSAAQLEFEPVEKDKHNKHLNYHYSSFSAIMASVRPALAKHGLALIQVPLPMDGDERLVEVEQTLVHLPSGEWTATRIGFLIPRREPQAVGSALTYAQKYLVRTVLGVLLDEDDDGDSASTPKPQERQVKSQVATRAAKPPAQPDGMTAEEVASKTKLLDEIKRVAAGLPQDAKQAIMARLGISAVTLSTPLPKLTALLDAVYEALGPSAPREPGSDDF